MPKEPSPHARTILVLINNAADLAIKHHEYDLAKDVIRVIEKICTEFGFDVENDIFGFIIDAIGHKPPIAMSEDFQKLVMKIQGIDYKLGKEPLANDKR